MNADLELLYAIVQEWKKNQMSHFMGILLWWNMNYMEIKNDKYRP